MMHKTHLRPDQIRMSRNLCLLILGQWSLLFLIVLAFHHYQPNRTIMFTTNTFLDFFIFLIIASFLIAMIIRTQANPRFPFWIRMTAYVCLGVLTSYLIAIEYNRAINQSPQPTKVERQFFFSWAATFAIFLFFIIMAPFVLPYANTMQIIGSIALCLLILIVLVLLFFPNEKFSPQQFRVFLSLTLCIFLVLLFSNMVLVIHQCKTSKNLGCDALNGATTVYIDIFSVMQNSITNMLKHM